MPPGPHGPLFPRVSTWVTRVTTENGLLESRGAWGQETSACSEVRTWFLGPETWTPRGSDLLRDLQGLSSFLWPYRGDVGGRGRQHLERAGMAKMPALPEASGWAVVKHDRRTRLFTVGEMCLGHRGA